jgi:hypothetical protein
MLGKVTLCKAGEVTFEIDHWSKVGVFNSHWKNPLQNSFLWVKPTPRS